MAEMRGSGKCGEEFPDGNKEEKDVRILVEYLKTGEKVFTHFSNPDAREINEELLEMGFTEMVGTIKMIPFEEIKKIKMSLNEIDPKLLADAYGGVSRFKILLEKLAN